MLKEKKPIPISLEAISVSVEIFLASRIAEKKNSVQKNFFFLTDHKKEDPVFHSGPKKIEVSFSRRVVAYVNTLFELLIRKMLFLFKREKKIAFLNILGFLLL